MLSFRLAVFCSRSKCFIAAGISELRDTYIHGIEIEHWCKIPSTFTKYKTLPLEYEPCQILGVVMVFSVYVYLYR